MGGEGRGRQNLCYLCWTALSRHSCTRQPSLPRLGEEARRGRARHAYDPPLRTARKGPPCRRMAPAPRPSSNPTARMGRSRLTAVRDEQLAARRACAGVHSERCDMGLQEMPRAERHARMRWRPTDRATLRPCPPAPAPGSRRARGVRVARGRTRGAAEAGSAKAAHRLEEERMCEGDAAALGAWRLLAPLLDAGERGASRVELHGCLAARRRPRQSASGFKAALAELWSGDASAARCRRP